MVVWILHWWRQQILEFCSHLSVLLSIESLAPGREAWQVTVTQFYLLNEGMNNLPTECNLCCVVKIYVEKVRNLQPEGGKAVMDQRDTPLWELAFSEGTTNLPSCLQTIHMFYVHVDSSTPTRSLISSIKQFVTQFLKQWHPEWLGEIHQPKIG